MERKFYLEDIPLEDAWAAFRAALDDAGLWRPLDAETVPLSLAHGRICLLYTSELGSHYLHSRSFLRIWSSILS